MSWTSDLDKRPAGYSCKKNQRVNWKVEIRSLMRDFCIPAKEREKIISSVDESKSLDETPEMLYQRAWKKFMLLV